MPRRSSRAAPKTPAASSETRVTRGSARSPAVKTPPAPKPPAKSTAKSPAVAPAAAASPKKASSAAGRSRSRTAAASKSPEPQRQHGRTSASPKRKSTSPKSAKTKSPATKQAAARGRSRQRKTKKTEETSVAEARTPVKRKSKGGRSKSKETTSAATKSPTHRASRLKSTTPKEKRVSSRGRRSRAAEEDEEHEDKEDSTAPVAEATAADTAADAADNEIPANESTANEGTVDKGTADEVTAAEDPSTGEKDSADEIKATDDNAIDEAEPMQTGDGDAEPQEAVPSHDDDSDISVELDEPPAEDRKRKFDEIDEHKSDGDDEENFVNPSKALKVCEDNGTEEESGEAAVDGEVASSAEARTDVSVNAAAEPAMSLPLSSETEVEDDYVVITPDDVPPVDSAEVMNTAAKMVPSSPVPVAASCENNVQDGVAAANPILQREYIANPACVSSSLADPSRCFTLGSYNILADCHAQRDYGDGKVSWVTPEQLSITSRHERLMEELMYLDQDVICLQEVGEDYMHDMLEPSMDSLGYKGVFISRTSKAYHEGEATFYRTSRFSLESNQSLILSDVISQAIDNSAELDDSTRLVLKESLSSYAVAMLTRLKSVGSDDVLSVANIHVAYDHFERQDRQCLQLAMTMQKLIELAGGLDKPHIICGDFNSWPGSPPYQLVSDGHLTDSSFTDLQAILTIDSGDSQLLPVVNFWSDGFQYSVGSAMKSAYATSQGREPETAYFHHRTKALAADYIWFSSVSLDVHGVWKAADIQLIKDGAPTGIFPSDHLSIKARFAFK